MDYGKSVAGSSIELVDRHMGPCHGEPVSVALPSDGVPRWKDSVPHRTTFGATCRSHRALEALMRSAPEGGP
jgi:hypothetical protein